MWFWLSLIALLCWSGSDLFSKIGCRDEDDRLSHLKMVMAVGVVMGLHAAFEIFVGGTEISFAIILTYLPVSLLYIGSMTLGYLGLRYIELSVSSPICNSSGALVAVMTLVFLGGEDYSPLAIFAVLLVCVGAIGLGVVDATEDPELRAARQAEGNRKYAKSFLALALPMAYCLLDAAGTFADNRVLETLDEGSANVAYELTFLFAAVVCFVYVVLIRRDRLIPKRKRRSTSARSARPPVSSPTSTPSRIPSTLPCPRPSSAPTARRACCGAACSSRKSSRGSTTR